MRKKPAETITDTSRRVRPERVNKCGPNACQLDGDDYYDYDDGEPVQLLFMSTVVPCSYALWSQNILFFERHPILIHTAINY
jgi:hypothetical protein